MELADGKHTSAETGFFESGGYRLAYAKRDNGKGRALLLLHGFMDSSQTFLFQEEFLSEYFDLYRFDYRGHGDSEWLREGFYHFMLPLVDTRSFITQFLPEKFHILGHSMGGGLGSRIAGLYPDRVESLVALEGFSSIPDPERERRRFRSWLDSWEISLAGKDRKRQKNFRSVAEAAARLAPMYPRLPEDRLLKITETLTKPSEDGFMWKSDPSYKNGPPVFLSPQFTRHLWESISCPVLVIYGKKTHLALDDSGEVFSHIKNLKYTEIEDAGHNMHHDRPEAVNELLREFYVTNLK
ncbi:alpha/beta hydrolase [Leptospira langatensis]|uniref:Alpha/beta hydrolase n=1 Tax=Leptospira langatensis TaxID=2484983 RepID=A0A5F1ZX96_9LEPT|nr:alpha/beta hydrolase [Leptospira langatensis]TGJ98568.1 alpha/beta hydrolase [Leptospira langatensis]TGL43482.1 alpha/beta hydrolase [Leptospira langatensis]